MASAERKLTVLFLCTGNSCRSQMAEGWTHHLKGQLIEVHSAGTQPKGLDPRAVRIMAEGGVDISRQRSKHVNDLADMPFDYVVTVCDAANEACPTFPNARTIIHVGFDDPPKLAAQAANEEQALSHYRRIRDEIRAFVAAMPQSLRRHKPVSRVQS